MNNILKSLSLAALTCAAASAGSIIIDIDATKYGCSQCNSYAAAVPGTNLTDIYNPFDQVTLLAGTYTITNADPNGLDQFGGWRFNGGAAWVWSFIVAQDTGGGTGTVLLDDYYNDQMTTEAAIANASGQHTYDGNTQLSATSPATFTDTLVLASTTTLDFLIDDYALGDNAGGVALNVSGPGIASGAPEPGTIGMMALGLLACGAIRRRFAK